MLQLICLLPLCLQVQIHDGPYNNLMNWNYTNLIEAMSSNQGCRLWTAKVGCFSPAPKQWLMLDYKMASRHLLSMKKGILSPLH